MFKNKIAILMSAALMVPTFSTAASASCITNIKIVNKSSRHIYSKNVASQKKDKKVWIRRAGSWMDYDYFLSIAPGATGTDKVDFKHRNDETYVKFRVKYRFLLKEGDEGYVAGKQKTSRVLLAESDVHKCKKLHTVVIDREKW